MFLLHCAPEVRQLALLSPPVGRTHPAADAPQQSAERSGSAQRHALCNASSAASLSWKATAGAKPPAWAKPSAPLSSPAQPRPLQQRRQRQAPPLLSQDHPPSRLIYTRNVDKKTEYLGELRPPLQHPQRPLPSRLLHASQTDKQTKLCQHLLPSRLVHVYAANKSQLDRGRTGPPTPRQRSLLCRLLRAYDQDNTKQHRHRQRRVPPLSQSHHPSRVLFVENKGNQSQPHSPLTSPPVPRLWWLLRRLL